MVNSNKNFFFQDHFDKCITKTGDNRKRKMPIRPGADFFKPSKSMKTDAKKNLPGTVRDIINLPGQDKEINDDSYLE